MTSETFHDQKHKEWNRKELGWNDWKKNKQRTNNLAE